MYMGEKWGKNKKKPGGGWGDGPPGRPVLLSYLKWTKHCLFVLSCGEKKKKERNCIYYIISLTLTTRLPQKFLSKKIKVKEEAGGGRVDDQCINALFLVYSIQLYPKKREHRLYLVYFSR